jgi:tripeptide aminopeptidase
MKINNNIPLAKTNNPVAGKYKLPKVDSQKVIDTFVSSAEIWAPSGHEKIMADKMIREFRAIDIKGMNIEVDDSASRTGSDTGNVIIDIPPSQDAPEDAKNICLSFHMDRVPVRAPGVTDNEPVQVEITKDGKIQSKDSRTNIAADDLCGYTAIKEGIELVHKKGIAHGKIRVIGFAKEEPGIFGARELDSKYLHGIDYGFEMDGGSIGNIIRSGGNIVHFNVTIHGQSAPSIHPWEGKNAMVAGIEVASLLSQIKRAPSERFNISNFESGKRWQSGEPVTNMVPDEAYIAGEIRSNTDGIKEMKSQVEEALKQSALKHNITYSLDYDEMTGYDLPEESAVVEFARIATENAGIKPKIITTMGGSDGNYMNMKGLPTVVIGSGAHLQHTEREYTSVNELVRGTQVIMSIIAATACSPVAAAAGEVMKSVEVIS